MPPTRDTPSPRPATQPSSSPFACPRTLRPAPPGTLASTFAGLAPSARHCHSKGTSSETVSDHGDGGCLPRQPPSRPPATLCSEMVLFHTSACQPTPSLEPSVPRAPPGGAGHALAQPRQDPALAPASHLPGQPWSGSERVRLTCARVGRPCSSWTEGPRGRGRGPETQLWLVCDLELCACHVR